MIRTLILCALLVAPSLALAQPASPTPPANLTILADANLLEPLAPLARSYARTQHVPLTISRIDANSIGEQIGQGLEAHVLLTADSKLIAQLAEQGQTDVSSAKQVARTQLALVGRADMQKSELLLRRISFAAMLESTPQLPVYIRPDNMLDGALAAKLRTGYSFSPTLDARAEEVDDPHASLTEPDAKPALAIMLATDAVNAPDALILSLLPEEISPAVRYQAVVLASESMNDARSVVNFLSSPEAQQVFARYGFQPPKK